MKKKKLDKMELKQKQILLRLYRKVDSSRYIFGKWSCKYVFTTLIHVFINVSNSCTVEL